jgi:hypothetical protein
MPIPAGCTIFIEEAMNRATGLRMKTQLIPTLLLLALAPLAVLAEEPTPAAAPKEQQAEPAAGEDLPYGAGYEARQRLAEQSQQASQQQSDADAEARTQTRNREESRAAAEARAARDVERSSAARASRREVRTERLQRGPAGR